jgi:thiol-disulfide isomerase/thioredoxin
MARQRVGRPAHVALVSGVLAALVAALVLSFVLGGGDDGEAAGDDVVRLTLPEDDEGPSITTPPNTSVGREAPDFTFESLDGEDVDFDELRDGRPALVNFFSETCVPCVTEMPDIEEAHQTYGDRVVFLGLAHLDTAEQAEELVERTGVTYETGRDAQGDVLTEFEGSVLPVTVFIDEDGTIRNLYQRRIRPAELREELEALSA